MTDLESISKAAYQPFYLLCDEIGKIVELNERSKLQGFQVGHLVQDFLVDAYSQRTWMQVLAELSCSPPAGLFTFCCHINQVCLSFECSYYKSGKNQSSPTVVKRLLLVGVRSNSHQCLHVGSCASSQIGDVSHSFNGTSSVAVTSALEHKYIYDMSLLDPSENAVICTDHLGRIIYYNETAREMYQYEPEEVVGKFAHDLFSHECNKDYGDEIMTKLKVGEKWQGTFITRNKNGDPLPSYVTDYPIFDSEGKVIGIVGVSNLKQDSHDVNRLKLPQSSPVVLTQLNFASVNSTALWCNDLFLKEMCLQELPVDKSMFALLGLPSGSATAMDEIVIETPLRNHRIVEAIELPSHNLTLIVLRDVSVRKTLEVSLKAATEHAETRAFKIDFITTMSHELRTPLHVLSAEIEQLERLMLEQSRLKQMPKDVVDKLMDSVYSMRYCYNMQMNLVKNVLDWQKFTSGKLHPIFNPFNIRSIIEELERNLQFFIQMRSLKLIINIDASVPHTIVSDESKLMHIITNLLTNAAKYTFANTEILVHISTANSDKTIQVEVADHGPGIPEPMRHLLFQRFAQMHPKEPDQRGIGLGLNIAKQLVEILGGEIGFRQTIGGGSTFFFGIPFQTRDHDSSQQPVDSTINIKSLVGSVTAENRVQSLEQLSKTFEALDADILHSFCPILVADDNIINQKTLEKMLRKIGFAVGCCRLDLANDGEEVLSMCENTEYKVIFMDMSMPRMDGVEATRRLRQNGWKHLILGVTANAMDEHRDTCLDAGMNAFLVKPLMTNRLKQVLMEYYQK